MKNNGHETLSTMEEGKMLVDHLSYMAGIGYGYQKSKVQYMARDFAAVSFVPEQSQVVSNQNKRISLSLLYLQEIFFNNSLTETLKEQAIRKLEKPVTKQSVKGKGQTPKKISSFQPSLKVIFKPKIPTKQSNSQIHAHQGYTTQRIYKEKTYQSLPVAVKFQRKRRRNVAYVKSGSQKP